MAGRGSLQQFVGINVVFQYGAELCQAAGYDESQSLFINLIGGTTSIVATFIAIALVDRIGRKPLSLIGSVGMTVTLGMLAWLFSTAELDADGKLVLIGNNGIYALVAANWSGPADPRSARGIRRVGGPGGRGPRRRSRSGGLRLPFRPCAASAASAAIPLLGYSARGSARERAGVEQPRVSIRVEPE